MEQNHEGNSDGRKRYRDDYSEDEGPEAVEPKRGRVDSSNSFGDSPCPIQNLAESCPVSEPSDNGVDLDVSCVDSPEAKRFHEFLDNLDDSDEQAILGLDSVMRSFEEEILVAEPEPTAVEMTSYSGGSQPDLGYLLEASDDELGLPPAVTSGDEEKVGEMYLPATVGSGVLGCYDEMLGFDEQIPRYCSYEFGLEGDWAGVRSIENYTDCGDFVVGGLFDFSEENSGHPDDPGLQWRTESLFVL